MKPMSNYLNEFGRYELEEILIDGGMERRSAAYSSIFTEDRIPDGEITAECRTMFEAAKAHNAAMVKPEAAPRKTISDQRVEDIAYGD